MEKWADRERRPVPDEWRAVRGVLGRANALEPDNPLFLEQLGVAYEARAYGLDAREPAIRALLEEALKRYRAAAMLRPSSPYVWASIALVKFKLGDTDDEFYGALARAARLGPWEPDVQAILAEIGFTGWSRLAEAGKRITAAAIERGTVTQPDEMKNLARLQRRVPGLCADDVARAPRFAALCGAK
jgi:hypothetical protein